MKLGIPRERMRLYLLIGAAYALLWITTDLFSNTETFFPRFFNNLWLVAYLVVFNYILFERSIPFIKITWRRLLLTPLILFAHLMFVSFGFYAWRSIGIGLNVYTPLIEHKSTLAGVEYHVPYSMFSVIFFGLIRYTHDFRQLKAAAQQLRIEKQEAELNYLKAQTNPHFLFNTLNNIYSLARDKSDLAPESILRLSKILRFMLYETSGDFIAIEQEIKVMGDYIELEKLRYDETLRINFNHDVEDMKQAIPPLLLMPLVENAFKHGVSETRQLPFVDIHLSVNKRNLKFVVKNSTETLIDEPVKENIGLSNLRRQLQLLYTDYGLQLNQDKGIFSTTLIINLSSHV